MKRLVGVAKLLFADPEAMLAYRIAISSERLIGFDATRVNFTVKAYRCDGAKRDGAAFLCDTLVVHV